VRSCDAQGLPVILGINDARLYTNTCSAGLVAALSVHLQNLESKKESSRRTSDSVQVVATRRTQLFKSVNFCR
jgi:hypothetical protein